MQILVIEDSDILRSSLINGLNDAGYSVQGAADGKVGLWTALEFEFDLIILDIMLPQLNGFELLEQLRNNARSSLVLMLTARDDVDDRVLGLRSGANDYLTKPFNFDELLARVEALLRRRAGFASNIIELNGIALNLNTKEVRIDNTIVRIPPREYCLLECLMLHKGTVVSREMIEQKIYDDAIELKSNVVDSAISSLRKLIDQPKKPSRIVTRRGHGYQIQ
ncbi:response regulator transcription factor [Reinekea sp. G2M2-21]|uniref:response regulator transcription factor n=1 Tax=Reinekea sp. G2M2-21 TaxID=2788942 RepID=UPI0018AC55CB|nr:response regulator transcription factor [Reinekea sp. G2M2-21]